MARALTELNAGVVIGQHRILATLGRGTMAIVYRALAPTGEEVALKVIVSEEARSPALVERFRREASAAARIAHPRLARCLGSGEENGVLYLVLELVEGRSLAERLRLSGKIEPREAARLGSEIAHALAAVHAAGFVHRDVKPENVLIDAAGGAKLTDLGVARRTITGGSLTHTGELVGTPEYMAPEQAEGARRVDARADLYSLGMVIHALVAGGPPFVGTAYSVITKQLTQTPPRLGTLVPGTPRELEALVSSLLAKDPDARPGDAAQVARELQVIARPGSGSGGRRRGPALAVAGAALAALVALAGWRALALRAHAPGGAPSTAARATPAATPAPDPAPTPEPGSREPPAWYARLAERRRPALPLPEAVAFGREGEYVALRDASVVLLYVPGGTFSLGNAGTGGEALVRLSPFFIGKYEVTNRQFRRHAQSLALVAPGARDRDKPATKPLSWEHPFAEPDAPAVKDDEPVVVVTPEQAIAYARSLGLDLPTEAQWERAAAWDPLAKSSRRFAWGETFPDDKNRNLANLADGAFAQVHEGAASLPGYEDGYARLAPVGQFPYDCSPAGCYDVTGNVRELCLDFWSEDFVERSRGATDPVQLVPDAKHARVVRGGSWGTCDRGLSLWSRGEAESASNTIGFRLALDAADDHANGRAR